MQISTQIGNIGGNLIQVVSARDVFKAINTSIAFAGWINYRIKKHGFIEGVDYVVTDNAGKKDFAMTVQMAHKVAVDGWYPGSKDTAALLAEFLPTPAEVVVHEARKATFAAPAHLKGVLTMSSVEIVEVINAMRAPGKAELAHRTFMEKVRNHPGINAQNFLHIYFDPLNREQNCYYLPKREAELMVMSESLEVQTKVYDRLTALEAAVVPKLPQSYAEALMELALNVQRTEALQLENAAKATQIEQQTMLIEHQKPAVEFVEDYVKADGTVGFRAMAKLLGAPEPAFRNFLYDNKYRYLEGGKWTHHKKWGDQLGGAGYFTLKTGQTAAGFAFTASYFTPRGVEFFTRKWKERNERAPVLTKKPGKIPALTSYNT